jgi:hypothetical protein
MAKYLFVQPSPIFSGILITARNKTKTRLVKSGGGKVIRIISMTRSTEKTQLANSGFFHSPNW